MASRSGSEVLGGGTTKLTQVSAPINALQASSGDKVPHTDALSYAKGLRDRAFASAEREVLGRLDRANDVRKQAEDMLTVCIDEAKAAEIDTSFDGTVCCPDPEEERAIEERCVYKVAEAKRLRDKRMTGKQAKVETFEKASAELEKARKGLERSEERLAAVEAAAHAMEAAAALNPDSIFATQLHSARACVREAIQGRNAAKTTVAMTTSIFEIAEESLGSAGRALDEAAAALIAVECDLKIQRAHIGLRSARYTVYVAHSDMEAAEQACSALCALLKREAGVMSAIEAGDLSGLDARGNALESDALPCPEEEVDPTVIDNDVDVYGDDTDTGADSDATCDSPVVVANAAGTGDAAEDAAPYGSRKRPRSSAAGDHSKVKYVRGSGTGPRKTGCTWEAIKALQALGALDGHFVAWESLCDVLPEDIAKTTKNNVKNALRRMSGTSSRDNFDNKYVQAQSDEQGCEVWSLTPLGVELYSA